MSDQGSTPLEHLEHARELVWEALQRFEEAQRVLFKAGDAYVSQVWGDGVRAVLDVTEKMADLSGELSATEIEIRRLAKRDRARGRNPD